MKLKIGFDPEGSWYNQAFREIMKEATLNENIEMYIVSNSVDSNLITEAQGYLQLDDSHTIRCTSMALMIDAIQVNNINIFIDADNTVVKAINSMVPLSNIQNNVTGCQAIHYNNSLVDVYKMQLKHYTLLQFWIGQIAKNLN
jgi:hypothetical protein